MNKIKICRQLEKTVRRIVVDNGSKIISAGTGVIVSSDGTMLTANHVIADQDVGLFNGKILVSGLGDNKSELEYEPVVHNLKLDVKQGDFLKPINLDLAILRPSIPVKKIEYVKLQKKLSQDGSEIIMAGFPDDLELPFGFVDYFNLSNPDMVSVKEAMDKRFKYFFRQLMFKSGMVGHAPEITFNDLDVSGLKIRNLTKINTCGAIYWLDNHLTYGGSGGPVVNKNGELVGILCKKAMTNEKDKLPGGIEKLPSGTGMALAHQLISWAL
jgi:V8-like Glu-specific endopeptidase